MLEDQSICIENRKLFDEFFTQLEYKLKRINGLDALDESCYKTLHSYFYKLRNVNVWFANKPWKELTKNDLQEVYDQLEDKKLKGISGKIITSKSDYYNRIFKSLPFELAGKALLVKEVMKYCSVNESKDVTFFTEEIHKQIANATDNVRQRLLCWIAWDWGENIFSNLQLQKKDFTKSVNPDTHEQEYILFFPNHKLKRSRVKGIAELNNYTETVKLLDIVLEELKPDDYLFRFGHRQAAKFLDKAVRKTNAQCLPSGKKPTWKDYRSSMACHLLKVGWTTDEIKKRMRHAPSSKVLDKYVSYLALDRHQPKQKVEGSQLSILNTEISVLKDREKAYLQRLDNQQQQLLRLQNELKQLKRTQPASVLKQLINHQNMMAQALSDISGRKFDLVYPINK